MVESIRANRLLLLWLGFLAVADPAQALATDSMPASGLLLPSQTCRGIFILPVTVQSTTLELMFDTGSSWTFLDPAALRRVLGRDVRAGRFSFESASIGAHALGPLRGRIYPMRSLGRALGRPIDGILGFPAFKDVLLTLDYPASEVRVDSGSLPPPDGRGIFHDTGSKRPHLEVRLDDRKFEVLLDSGATPGDLHLRRNDRVDWSVAPRPVRTTFLFNRFVVDSGGRLMGNLEFGPLEVETPLAFQAGRERQVGWQILHHFALTFDQKKKRIRIVPHTLAGPITTPSFVSKGFGVRPQPEGLEIVKVFAGTPAAAAGFRQGDLIIAIDGTPVYERPCQEPNGDPEGTGLRISYLRDGAAAEVEIQTVALIP